MCDAAALHGQFEMLKYVRSKGFSWGVQTFRNAVEYCVSNHEDDVSNDVLENDVRYLAWMRSQGCPWDESVCACAAGGYRINLETLVYPAAEENFTDGPLETASMKVLCWLTTNKCPWSEHTFVAALRFQASIDYIRWLVEMGCPWSPTCCLIASEEWMIDVLTFIREQGCPWNEDECTIALNNGKLDKEFIDRVAEHCRKGINADAREGECITNTFLTIMS